MLAGDPEPNQVILIMACNLQSELISPWCQIYASENQVSIGSDNGLSPIRHQAII